ncbi:MAG: hypothetical protein F7C37_06115 [Desulfurococcales archaeon]|nr:hypothetical protein [Desulfurococcales archaeon]
MSKSIPWRLFIDIGSKSRERTEAQLEELGRGLAILVHIDEIPPELNREFNRWKRKQLLASLRGDDPSAIEPPATLRVALARAFTGSSRKLVLALEELEVVEDAGGEEG